MSTLTLEYWVDDGWFVGKLKEVPGVFSQGETLDELIENVKDAYRIMIEDSQYIPVGDYKTIKLSINM